jgi:hypothetical protein
MDRIIVASGERRLIGPAGETFFVLGVNYEGYHDRAWQMWEAETFDLALIERDFRKAKDIGFNTLRLFVQRTLAEEIQSGNFDKLDWALELASRQELYVLLSLNDAHWLNLTTVGELNEQIAEHCRGNPTLLAYDLENEPKLYHLLAAVYPEEYPTPVHSMALVDHYGEQVSRAEVKRRQQEHRIPGHLDDDMAYYYANALELFIAFDQAFNQWHGQTGSTIVDYVHSPDSAHWSHYIEVMDGTLAAWIAAQRDPIRVADPDALLTIGYNWLQLAALPANGVLDFHQFHLYGSRNLESLRALTRILDSLQSNFPGVPVLLGEFGYSNASGTNPAESQPVSQNITAIYEGALLACLRARGFAGGLKWVLNDATNVDNPFEANLGVFAPTDQPKVIAEVVTHYADLWASMDADGEINLRGDAVSDTGYNYTVPKAMVVAGGRYQDLAMDWQSSEGTHLYLAWDDNVTVEALSQGRMALNPTELLSDWADHSTILHRMVGNERQRLAVFPADERATWTVQPEVTYVLTRGAKKPEPPPQGEIPEPGLGEHVVILPDADEHLDAARAYLRRFLPDVAFDPDAAVGRWPYMTIVGDTNGVTEAQEQALENAGAWVERVAGDDLNGTRNLLDGLAAEGRRFLEGAPEPPPPPSPPPPPPEPPEPTTYTVLPGDSLWRIAVKVYGDGRLWPIIFEANRDVLDDPSRIRVGQVLKIPPKPE